MGRLHHLKETLPASVRNSSSYPNREFVVLDYNSPDGLFDWISQFPADDNGIVKYYRTVEPQYYVATHAKNVGHKLATGDILCNLDADNYVLPGFCEYLCDLLGPGNVDMTSDSFDQNGEAGCTGKIAVLREHFYSVNGYNEEVDFGWWWDDVEFEFRVRMANDLKMIYCDPKYSLVIPHSDDDRLKNRRYKDVEASIRASQDKLLEIAGSKRYRVNEHGWGEANIIYKKSFNV